MYTITRRGLGGLDRNGVMASKYYSKALQVATATHELAMTLDGTLYL